MADQTSVPTERLLAAVLATHDAFATAARTVNTAGFAAEFAQRAEYQERIVVHLRGSTAPFGLASDKLRRVPDVAVVAADARHPRMLFDTCLRVQDAATLEYCRCYGPNLSFILSSALLGAFPVNTTRHAVRKAGMGSSSVRPLAEDYEARPGE